MTPRRSDAEILADIHLIITDLNWIITRSNDLMNAGWEPVDIERERIELRNWRAMARWLEHRIELDARAK